LTNETIRGGMKYPPLSTLKAVKMLTKIISLAMVWN